VARVTCYTCTVKMGPLDHMCLNGRLNIFVIGFKKFDMVELHPLLTDAFIIVLVSRE
jgi:hypothetical protein